MFEKKGFTTDVWGGSAQLKPPITVGLFPPAVRDKLLGELGFPTVERSILSGYAAANAMNPPIKY